ncbi:MAG: 2-amino-4-hydroxy-6-hydroxymethyldihydropteridine diphosphokinase [Chitinophagaceae bacterium]
MNKVYLLTGGNIGNRKQNLQQAALLLEQFGTIEQKSGLYQTAAWGKTDQPAFLNQVLLLHTTLSPTLLLEKVLATELTMGRMRMEKYGPRIIDIDILFYNDEVIDLPALTVPHPQLPNRRFVLAPLNEIAPHLVHPVLHKTISQLLEECPDELEVVRI